MMAGAAVLAGLFVLWQRRRAAEGKPQLLDYALLSNRNFLLGMVIVTIYASGIPGFFMVISLLLQAGFHFTPLESGLTNTPFSVGVVVASLIAGRLGSRALRRRLAAGAGLLVLGLGWLHVIIAGLGDTIAREWFMAPLFFGGIGLGLGFSALFQSILAGVPPRDAGSGSGALQAFQQVGGAVGVALVGEIFFRHLASGLASGGAGHAAYAEAAAAATIYQIVSFAVVVALVPFLKPLPKSMQGGPRLAPAASEG
jgi:MFS family permease